MGDQNKTDLGREQALLVQVLGDDLDGALDVDFVCPDVDLGLGRGLVRRRDTGELCLSAFDLVSCLLAQLYEAIQVCASTSAHYHPTDLHPPF